MIKRTIAITCAALTLAACQNPGEEGAYNHTLLGAGLGAAGGAALGTLVGGNDRRNALVGAGIGLLAGGVAGNYMDRQEAQLRHDLAGTGASVSRNGDDLLVTLPASVTFAFGKADLQPQFHSALNRFGKTLNQYPNTYIDVIGHTDNVGSDAYNQTLSVSRANSVRNYLSAQGVLPARMLASGQGEQQPIATNETPAGRRQNRRVEIRIVPATA